MRKEEMRKLFIKAKEDLKIDRTKLLVVPETNVNHQDGRTFIQRRVNGQFIGKAFWLNSSFDWELGLDDEGEIVLVPIEK